MSNMESDTSSNTNSDVSLSWKKMERDNKKIGFREGISDGRDKIFQKNFDDGYRQGFRNALLMGKYKGALKVASLENHTTINEEQLHHSRKGLCCLCKDTDLLEKSIKEIETLQQRTMEEFSEMFNAKYCSVSNVIY